MKVFSPWNNPQVHRQPASWFRSDGKRLIQIRLRRGMLVCLVYWPSARCGGLPHRAIIASVRSPHLRRWRLSPGQRAATPRRPVPRAV